MSETVIDAEVLNHLTEAERAALAEDDAPQPQAPAMGARLRSEAKARFVLNGSRDLAARDEA